MRGNLLRAISHDIRTPARRISGASAAILENKDALSAETKEKLIANIQDESQWLIRMVENLLSVTRLDENAANLKKLPEAAEEVVADAIGRIRKRFPARVVAVSVPEDYLEVPMDGTLIAQVLINLLENAVKFSPEHLPIEVSLKRDGGNAVFEVADHGKGIPTEETLHAVFRHAFTRGAECGFLPRYGDWAIHLQDHRHRAWRADRRGKPTRRRRGVSLYAPAR